MDLEEFNRIVAGGETQEVEFKESFHSNQEVSKILCGLANSVGGLLIIGIKDSGEVVGISGSVDELQQQVSAASQNVSPVPLVSIEVKEVDGKKVLIAVVQRPSDYVYYTFQGAVFVRVGSTTKRLDGLTQLEFLRSKQFLSFDESIEPLAKIDDLDEEKIKAYLSLREQKDFFSTHSIKDFLISSKLAFQNGGFRIKNAAILLFGKNTASFLPQAEIKLVHFAGVEPVEILAHKLLQEDAPTAINDSLAFVKSKLNKVLKITESAMHEEEYEYPIKVVREAIVNAVAHRDYFSKDAVQIYVFDNRIEITNPGSLPHALPKELFGTVSVQRNPITYRFLRDLGFVEGLGTGIPRMKNQMRKAGLSDPEFLFTESFFRITLFNKEGFKKPVEDFNDLSERQKKAIEYLKKNKVIKTSTYVKINKISQGTAVSEINELIEFGYLKKIGSYKGAYYILVS